jgi:HlyD family secretion protein
LIKLEAIMQAYRKSIWISFLLIALLTLNGCDVLTQSSQESLTASGVVEVVEVAVSAEIGGRVENVYVEEGDAVSREQILFDVDDDELQLQREQIMASSQAAVTQARLELIQAEQALEDLYEAVAMTRAQTQKELADAKDALDDAEYMHRVRQQGNRASQATIDAAEARLLLAEKAVDRAKAEYDKYSGRDSDSEAKAIALRRLANARIDRDAALRDLNWYKGSPTEIDQTLLDADVAMAEARVEEAQRQLGKWENGPDPDEVAVAEARIAFAQASLELAEIQQEAQLRSLDLKLEDTVIKAPIDGVILTKSVDEGEVISPGVSVITLGNVVRMKLTVYIPENQYGQVDLGDQARVEVDSFPGEIFSAEVIRIADEAEYTPRNVQTEEERQTTVFAIQLAVEDPEGKLKPGMPADVTFEG